MNAPLTDAEIEQLRAELDDIEIDRALYVIPWMLGAFGIAALGIGIWLAGSTG